MVSLIEEATSVASTLRSAAKDIFSNVSDLNKTSLSAYARPTTIVSRVYIDGSIYQEPIINPILKTIHTLYASWIINALQMNRLVTAGRSVQDMLHVVSNESLYEDIGAAFEKLTAEEQVELDKEKEAERRASLEADTKAGELRGGASGQLINMADGHTPIGKLIEVTLTNPDNKDASVKLNLLVQLMPYAVPEGIAYKLITMDALPSFFQRFLQWTAGEISFWRDFVFQLDIVNDRRKSMLEDKDHILAEYLREQWNSKLKLWNNVEKDPQARKRNIASTVLVMSSSSILKAKLETGIDFNNKGDRERFFVNSLCMIVAVVDNLYNHITLYFNGMDEVGIYTFDSFNSVSKKGDSALDIITALSAFSKGGAPRF